MKVFLHGSLNNRNFGDELLVSMMSFYVTRKRPGVTVHLKASEKCFDEIKQYTNVKNIKTILGISKVDTVIFGGGGYFGSPSEKLSRWDINFSYKFFPIFLLSIFLRKRILIFGTGFGPMPFVLNRWFLKRLVRRSSRVFVRDVESMRFVREDLKCDAKLTSDMVSNRTLFMDFIKHNVPMYKYKEDKYIVLHNISYNFFENTFAEREDLSDYHFIIMYDSEKEFQNAEITNYLTSNNVSFEIEGYESIGKVINIISGAQLVLTSKLHVGIVSTTLGVSTISVPVHIKTIRYYQMFKIEDICLDKDQLKGLPYMSTIKDLIDFSSKILVRRKSKFDSFSDIEACLE